MNTSVIIEVLLTLVLLLSGFFIFVKLFSRYHQSQNIRLTESVKFDIIETLPSVKTTGWTEHDANHNFPSFTAWRKSRVLIAEDFMVIMPKSNFRFLFKKEWQPFIIAPDDERQKRNFNFERVFVPIKSSYRSYKNDVEIVLHPAAIAGDVKIHLIFENLKMNERNILSVLNKWC